MSAIKAACAFALISALSVFNASAETINIPPVEITSLSHFAWYNSLEDMGGVSDTVTFPSGPGTFSGPGFTAAIGNGDTVVARFEAPAGKAFVVTHHPTAPFNTFSFYAEWRTGEADWGSYSSVGTITFENLTGTAPTEVSKQFMVSDNGKAISLNAQFNVIGDFEFTAIKITFTVSQPLADISRTYLSVDSSSSPSFGTYAGTAVFGGPVADQTVMAILPIGPRSCQDVIQGGYQLPLDLNGDCHVDFADFAILASGWLSCNDPADAACTPNWP
jgi:hypothetical protein